MFSGSLAGLVVAHAISMVKQMDPQITDVKHTDYYLYSENNVLNPFLAVLDGRKFFELFTLSK